jgi:sugar lactone lactonase YvrE
LPAGDRSVAWDADTGWILSAPFDEDGLLLTAFSLDDGSASTTELVDGVKPSSDVGLTLDKAGDLWVTLATRVLRITPHEGAVRPWDLPPPPSDAAPSDEDVAAGYALAAAWEPQADVLLFLRSGDHRLYAFDPKTGGVTTLADLPMSTSYVSDLVVGPDGTIAVTGSRIGPNGLEWDVVVLENGGSIRETRPGIGNVCAGSSSMAVLGVDGTVSVLNGSAPLTQVAGGHPYSTAFACDADDNIFHGAIGGAELAITRISPTGDRSTEVLPLVETDANLERLGVSPSGPIPLGPGLEAIIPDQSGGAWVVTSSGTQRSQGDLLLYPSASHIELSD